MIDKNYCCFIILCKISLIWEDMGANIEFDVSVYIYSFSISVVTYRLNFGGVKQLFSADYLAI